MAKTESFEEKLNRWTLNELMIERTKKNIYSDSKLNRTDTRIAELQYGNSIDEKLGVQTPKDSLYIASARLDNLRLLKSDKFDLQRVIRLCEEMNSSWKHDNLIAVGALTRILLNHVPPVFGQKTFIQVAANSSRSLKAVFETLEQSSRKISDSLIHQAIRKKETLPTEQMVNFSQSIDVLLAEIIRIIEESNA